MKQENHKNFKNHSQENTLLSYIHYSGLMALSTVFSFLLSTNAHSTNRVSITVLHICTSPLTPHYSVPQLQPSFTPSATRSAICSTPTRLARLSSSCCPLCLLHVSNLLCYSIQSLVNPSLIYFFLIRGGSGIPAALTSDASQVTTLLGAVAIWYDMIYLCGKCIVININLL